VLVVIVLIGSFVAGLTLVGGSSSSSSPA